MSAFSNFSQNISEKLQEQSWFIQLKSKWEEQDAKTREGLSLLFTILFFVLAIYIVYWSSHRLSETNDAIDEKSALIQKIQSSQDEIRKLKEQTAAYNQNNEGTWAEFFKSKATGLGLDTETMAISAEKAVTAAPVAASKDKNKEKETASPMTEAIYEIGVKKINVKQLVKFVYQIENGGRSAKVRDMHVITQADESGYLDLNLVVSAFNFK